MRTGDSCLVPRPPGLALDSSPHNHRLHGRPSRLLEEPDTVPVTTSCSQPPLTQTPLSHIYKLPHQQSQNKSQISGPNRIAHQDLLYKTNCTPVPPTPLDRTSSCLSFPSRHPVRFRTARQAHPVAVGRSRVPKTSNKYIYIYIYIPLYKEADKGNGKEQAE